MRKLAAVEARGFWWGRWTCLWIALAVAMEAWLCLWPKLQIGDSLFTTLCKLAAWVPAWLCADLLALGFRGNREPLRERRPREFLARALGRLGPFWLALILWAGTWTGRAIAGEPRGSWASGGGTWLPWTLVFVASGLPLAAAAALLSAAGRKPRRWVVTWLVVAAAMACESLVIACLDRGDWFLRFHTPAEASLGEFGGQLLVYPPNLWTGYLSALCLATLLRVPEKSGLGVVCALACVAFILYALPPFLAACWVTRRRWRRVSGPGQQAPSRTVRASTGPPSRPHCPALP